MKKVLALILSVGMCFGCVGCGDKKDDKHTKEYAIYKMVVDASYKFKSPSSVRVVSGKVYYYEIKEEYKETTSYNEFYLEKGYYISGNLRLSATNGWGATVSGYYDIQYVDNGIEMIDIEEKIEYWEDYDQFLCEIYQNDLNECQILDDFNIETVNSLLSKHWKSY